MSKKPKKDKKSKKVMVIAFAGITIEGEREMVKNLNNAVKKLGKGSINSAKISSKNKAEQEISHALAVLEKYKHKGMKKKKAAMKARSMEAE